MICKFIKNLKSISISGGLYTPALWAEGISPPDPPTAYVNLAPTQINSLEYFHTIMHYIFPEIHHFNLHRTDRYIL